LLRKLIASVDKDMIKTVIRTVKEFIGMDVGEVDADGDAGKAEGQEN
jgi:hypothetical protein